MATMKFAGASLLLLAAPAYAQLDAQSDETITVRPPYVVTKSTSGAPRERTTTYTISRVVPYGDLDLKSDAGVQNLEGRVRDAANGVCGEIDRRYPDQVYAPVEGGDCANNAVAQAAPQVRGAIKHARG
jgi:UrcA family protein